MSTLSKPLVSKPAFGRAGVKKMRATFGLSKPDLISIQDLTPTEVEGIMELTGLVKTYPNEFARALDGKQIVLIFEKPSLRTRLTFEVGIRSLGGSSLFVDQRGARIDEREALSDVAHNLERWVDGIVLRTFAHDTVTGMADYAGIPVINGLSDLEHPCQALADYFTVREKFGDLRKVKLAYVGDGNNVAHSLMLAAAALGSHIAVATPLGFEPDTEIVNAACELAMRNRREDRCQHGCVVSGYGCACRLYRRVGEHGSGRSGGHAQERVLAVPGEREADEGGA